MKWEWNENVDEKWNEWRWVCVVCAFPRYSPLYALVFLPIFAFKCLLQIWISAISSNLPKMDKNSNIQNPSKNLFTKSGNFCLLAPIMLPLTFPCLSELFLALQAPLKGMWGPLGTPTHKNKSNSENGQNTLGYLKCK